MTVGFVMLVDAALERAAQVARHWAESGCPVVIHVDAEVTKRSYDAFRRDLADLETLEFVETRRRCEWGSWDSVAATMDGAEMMLDAFPDVRHVYLATGACLPLRPVAELQTHLAGRPHTDFIESATVESVDWSKGGFDRERFTFRSPLSSRKQGSLFDRVVRLQRRSGRTRQVPEGLVPHRGSPWWCLTRSTLSALLQDPRRREYEDFFRSVQAPDQSYFQTLVRKYAWRVESRSLTLSKLDYQGRSQTFYDDHLQLLRRSDCFVARKIWPLAERLYSNLLSNDPGVTQNAEPDPGKIDRLFNQAIERRTRGRPGLYMQSRFPLQKRENGESSGSYSVFEGFDDLFDDFEAWLSKTTGNRVHGHLYGPGCAEFAGGEAIFNGGLSDSAAIRDYNPCAFLRNLVWNTRGERQCFMFGPSDNQDITDFIAGDRNAQISVITGTWAIRLFRQKEAPEAVRKEAARLQRIEQEHVRILGADWAKARIRIWPLAEFIEAPMDNLQCILDEIGPRGARRLTEAPRLTDLTGFGRFLQELKNEGMAIHLAGEFSVGRDPTPIVPDSPRRLVVK
ncbi:beta-1,6-N-acetylglucosaminyltransferase [Tropicimonas isoalkanivorans]|uniref:Core-2/I-Branching enzyme n=1 Tax=Tropicimonas isoalkanivorans TaxID=441112 RepID=A0A1I1M776_9RHOB|nr:beta-1,6-N-acetylglucosaminyltransferase [Tropicimonas isoalkanivorans]SFC79068.1 Core-2/I-Branching enzyme [Tropicimonas isoalkanivorans]